MAVRRRGVWCAAAATFLLTAAPGAQPPDRFAQWLEAIKAHEPGNPGKVAVEVSTWSGAELEAVILDAKGHVGLMDESQRDEANDLLLRGAALHADIARLIPDEMVRRSSKQQSIYVVRDGREQGTRFVTIHWGLGRSLLDAIEPEPAAHPEVLRWYQQTSNELIRTRALAEAAIHLPRARQIFPSDPVLLFASGILHERFSSASLQAAAASILAANRQATAVNTTRAELGRAERFFRETLAVDPTNVEARVRYGRVLGALGRHAQAAETLHRAIQGGVTGQLRYFAELFLGSQEEALGNPGAARTHFERAAALYPRAQSPRLAMSQLSRRAGDRAGAQRELRVLSDLPDDERQREDPWWDYYDAH